ncbi:hypothetical protein ACSSNL_11975 [Thalassobius sp. S69A]|uniref:hypothetical protein n=1 Tax=unclassified Thalassovita TaxID=2619711 RepID=UPI000C10C380|nr:oxidoreductase [Paracoccaceae bacterium]MBT26501.1 oxidoreductase [Paracoccaceae bacterium]
MGLKQVLAGMIALVLALGVANAEDAPESQPMIEVVYLDQQDRLLNSSQVSMDELLALPAAEFTTSTIWTIGPQTFRGVWLSDLMEYLKISEGEIYLSALNEYLVEIPLSEMFPGGPLVAYERNGAPMGARDKGPLWVVFPYDSDERFRAESVYAQSIWQMDRIEVYQ